MADYKYGKLVAVPISDYSAALKTAVDEGMLPKLEAALKQSGIDQIVVEEAFYDLIKSSINEGGERCSCNNNMAQQS